MKGCTLRFFVGLQKDILQYLYSASGKRVALDSIEDILGELSGDADVSLEDDPPSGTRMQIHSVFPSQEAMEHRFLRRGRVCHSVVPGL